MAQAQSVDARNSSNLQNNKLVTAKRMKRMGYLSRTQMLTGSKWTLRDRVCMTAAMLVLEPIFEADLPPEQYAYRPGRNAQQAVVEVEAQLFRGRPDVVDADLADYFGSIAHAELLKSVARRIVDRRVVHLNKMWLESPEEETDDRGRKTRTTAARDPARLTDGSLNAKDNFHFERTIVGFRGRNAVDLRRRR